MSWVLRRKGPSLLPKARIHHASALAFLQENANAPKRKQLHQRLTKILTSLIQVDRGSLEAPVAKGLRRLERVVQSRLELLNRVEAKIASKRELNRTERHFVERMKADFSRDERAPERDRLVEQADYFLQLQGQGIGLKENLREMQKLYYGFIHEWNERRRNPEAPEFQHLHVSETAGYDKVFHDYRRAVETTFTLYGITPRRFNGELIPEIKHSRDGDSFILEPPQWQKGERYSRGALWRFLLGDTLGIVKVARHLSKFDDTPQLYLFLHSKSWGWRMMHRVQTRIRVENTEELRKVANTEVIVAPTHDSAAEFPTIPSILMDYGIQAFFMADRKFFDSFPKLPTLGLLKFLLGPMEQYGHLAINRSNRKAALQVMTQAGESIRNKKRSLVIFPAGTRNKVRYEKVRYGKVRYGKKKRRYEGPIYGSKPGIALAMEAAQAPILPLGMLKGGIIFPKQVVDAFFRRGAVVGQEYVIRFGKPLFYEDMIEKIPNKSPSVDPRELGKVVVPELDQQYAELTGRSVGPPAPSKAKKRRNKTAHAV